MTDIKDLRLDFAGTINIGEYTFQFPNRRISKLVQMDNYFSLWKECGKLPQSAPASQRYEGFFPETIEL